MSRHLGPIARWSLFLATTRQAPRPVALTDPGQQRERVRAVTHDALLDLDFHTRRTPAPNRS